MSELQTSCVSILGDWNADTSDRNSEFGRHPKLFCSDINLIISDEIILPDDTFTHMSERWHTTSWLDHCVSSGDGYTGIKYMAVLYSTCCSDHIPNTVDIAIASIPVLEVATDAHLAQLGGLSPIS